MPEESEPTHKNSPDGSDQIVKGLTIIVKIVSKIGINGTIVASILYFLIFRATDEQQHELIDILLLKFAGQGAKFYIIAGLILLYTLGQRWYYRKELKLKQEQIDEFRKHEKKIPQKSKKSKP